MNLITYSYLDNSFLPSKLKLYFFLTLVLNNLDLMEIILKDIALLLYIEVDCGSGNISMDWQWDDFSIY